MIGVDPPPALDRQRLTGELVDDVQQLQVVPVSGLVELEVDRPHVIGCLSPQPLRRSRRGPEPLALAALLRDPKPLLAPQPLRALAVQLPALIEQQLMRTAIPPPRPAAGDATKLCPQRSVVAATTGSWRWVERC